VAEVIVFVFTFVFAFIFPQRPYWLDPMKAGAQAKPRAAI
jgi:hypothetical protein